jgi:hypothetical protein
MEILAGVLVVVVFAILVVAVRGRPIWPVDQQVGVSGGGDRSGLARRSFVLGAACGVAIGAIGVGRRAGGEAGREKPGVSSAGEAVPVQPCVGRFPGRRVILPMYSTGSVMPGQAVLVTSRPQNGAFRPERCVISGADDWFVEDVRVGGVSQWRGRGGVPGGVFGANALENRLEEEARVTSCMIWDTVGPGVDLSIAARYVGSAPGGAPFVCAVLGSAAS